MVNATVKTDCGLQISENDIYGGDFLSNGKLLLAVNNMKLILCNIDGVLAVLQEKKLSGSPFCVCCIWKNEVLITIPDEKKVLRLDLDLLEIKDTVSLQCKCYGIATSGNITVIGTRN